MATKLFVGQIPKSMTEEQLTPLFQQYGTIVELAVIRDKTTGGHKGCAFLTYTTKEEAEACIAELHNKHTMPGMPNSLQVKYSGPQSGGSSSNEHSTSYRNSEHKLFIGMIPRAFTTEELMPVFTPFGDIEELSILRGPDGHSKGCAFLRFVNRDSAVSCVTALNGALKLPGAPANLVVKFAESEREKEKQRVQQQKQVQSQAAQLQQIQLLQLANLAPLITQQLYAQSAWDQYSQQLTGQQRAGSNPAVLQAGMGSIGGQHMGNSVPEEGPPGANLFVYHLPQEYTDVDLYQTFSPFGNILSAQVYVDKKTNQSRGFGFVNYDAPEAAQVAVTQMDGCSISGKRLKVQVKVHHTNSSSSPYHSSSSYHNNSSTFSNSFNNIPHQPHLTFPGRPY